MTSTSFSGHETFPLRFLWLPKAVRAAATDPDVFGSSDAIARFGVGKNMVRAMKHWGLATGVLQHVDGARGSVEPTGWGASAFGEGGSDPFCERAETAWRLHWGLCRDPERATLWHYLFGHWHGGGVDIAALEHEIGSWLTDRGASVPSTSTLKRDLLCFGACYAPTRSARAEIEDAGSCPLAGLGLVSRSAGTLYLREGRRAGITAELFSAVVLDYWNVVAFDRRSLSVDEVLKHDGSPGRVFLLNEEQGFELVEAAAALDGAPFQVDQTANLYQLYRSDAAEPARLQAA